MKQIIFTIALLSLVYGQDFRKTTWGMSKAQVKEVEGIPHTQHDEMYNEEILVYKMELAGYKSTVKYKFTEDKLIDIYCGVNEEILSDDEYIDDYEIFKNLLSKKFGEPDETKICENEDIKSDSVFWGLNISLGRLSFFSTWKTENSEIDLVLTKATKYTTPERDIQTILGYHSLEWEKTQSEKRAQAESEKKAKKRVINF